MNSHKSFKRSSQKNSRRKFLEKLGFGSFIAGGGIHHTVVNANRREEGNESIQVYSWDPFDYGAKGDGKTLDTKAIQTAIDNCHLQGGGIVYLKKGIFLSGTIYLKSNVTIYLEAGAILKASREELNFHFSGHTAEGYNEKYYYLLVAVKQENISIAGQGTILGTGENDLGRRPDEIRTPTPFRIGILHLKDCKQIDIKDIEIHYSDFWTLHFYLSEMIFIDSISILNNYYHTNSDGIDLVSCEDVFISNCLIVAGDDCICLKTKNGFSCKNVVVSNCILESVATAIKLGTSSEGDFRDVLFTNCTIRNSGVGIGFFIKDGGEVDRIIFSNIIIESTLDLAQINDGLINTITPIFVDVEKRYENSVIGKIRDITFRDIYINSGTNSLIQGLPESRIENLVLENVNVRINKAMDFSNRIRRSGGYSTSNDSRLTEYIRQPTYLAMAYVSHLTMRNVRIIVSEEVFEQYDRSAVALSHIRGGMIQDVNMHSAGILAGAQAILNLNNCQNIYVSGCFALPNTNAYIHIEGENTTGIAIKGNDFSNAKNPVKITDVGESEIRFENS